ncbi:MULTISPECIES: ABC transporter ATP-binding protein [Natrialbaceae]|uniref:ABC transporter ATP-binding protein n=1 Tax=Natrialbaceae TaxID=1644061 RepID=UPI00207C4D6D|nr:ABC transporter ATP-binding protein [Natronococcus sp. CG52]
MSLLEINNLTKDFGSVLAVNDVSFDVDNGEFVSILGPSGSGKSTILRMVAGFESPTSGEILLNGEDMVGQPPFERNVNMMFQGLALFPHLTVAGNIEYGLKQSGVPKEKREQRVTEMLDVVHLSGYEDRKPDELSGGEQQRVALARAIVNEPELVLFDEPLASLDRKLRQHMQVELQRIQRETGISFLYVTHDQEVAMAVSDKLVLLNEGQIEQVGTAEELYVEPSSKFVADFIGDVNVIPASVEHVNETDAALRLDEQTVRVDDATLVGELADITGANGSTIDLCIRPHQLELHGDPPSEPHTLTGTVENRIYQGENVSYRISTSLGTFVIQGSDDQFSVDDDVYVTWSHADAQVFPAEKESA